MALTQQQTDATRSAMAGSKRVGLYKGLDLTLPAFRKKPCTDLVKAGGKTCPLTPLDYGTPLITFREKVRAKLKDKGYERPLLMLQLVCAKTRTEDGDVPWTWGDWCDHLANRL